MTWQNVFNTDRLQAELTEARATREHAEAAARGVRSHKPARGGSEGRLPCLASLVARENELTRRIELASFPNGR